ncbi:MAG: OmpA family protein [Gemmatimonadota bacterium]|nr:OmpA family protein [Gemmatimonadota bacterium]
MPWSDLMMTMFILFTVLFVYSTAERDLGEAVPRTQAKPEATLGTSRPFSGIFEQSEAAVRETNLDDIDVELQADRSVKLSVRGPMFFDLGRARLRPSTTTFLERVATILQGNSYAVQVVGHTDSYPVSNENFPTNWELSAVRATTVARYLIERGDLDPGRFTVIGHSMYRPLSPNNSQDNRARNRRVEIIITPEMYSGTGSPTS